jgi:hypothetical protein
MYTLTIGEKMKKTFLYNTYDEMQAAVGTVVKEYFKNLDPAKIGQNKDLYTIHISTDETKTNFYIY